MTDAYGYTIIESGDSVTTTPPPSSDSGNSAEVSPPPSYCDTAPRVEEAAPYPVKQAAPPGGVLAPRATRLTVPGALTAVNTLLFCLTLGLSLYTVCTLITAGTTGPYAAPARPYDLCLPCADLRLSDPEDAATRRGLAVRRTPGTAARLCCAETPPQISLLVHTLVERRLREEQIKGTLGVTKYVYIDNSNGTSYLSTTKPSANLVGMLHMTPPSGQRRVVTWDYYRDSLAFMRNGVDYRDGRLIVPQTGVYHVYCQLHFRQSSRDDNNSHNQPMGQYLYRYNIMAPNMGDEKLMESTQTRPMLETEVTTYMAGSVSLARGDEIFVKVFNMSVLALNPRVSYFGLYLI